MRRKLSKWHRRIGLVSLGLLSWLAITGVLLNHSQRLGFDHPIGIPYIADVYGIQAECSALAWRLPAKTLIDCGPTVLFADAAVDELHGPLLGAQVWQDVIYIAAEQGLLIMTALGERIEWISADLLPGRPLRLGLLPEKLVLHTPAGVFSSDSTLSTWTSVPDHAEIQWSIASTLDDATHQRAQSLAAVRQLSWTKLLQDLHSGRIIGLAGTVLADLGALSMLTLALLGLFMSSRLPRRPQPPAEAPTPAGPGDTPNA